MRRHVLLSASTLAALLVLLASAHPARTQQQSPTTTNGAADAPREAMIYIACGVVQPHARRLKEMLTVTQAVALAGGVRRGAKKDRVYIIRFEPNDTFMLKVNLKAIAKRRAPDVTLQRDDVVMVDGAGDCGDHYGLRLPLAALRVID